MKKILMLAVLICLASLVSADMLTELNIPTEIHLGETITIFGVFSDTSGNDANVLCSFYILDANAKLVERPDDEFTDGTGRFSSSSLTLKQPPFFQGTDYNVAVVCDTAVDSRTFEAQNFRDVAFNFFTAFEWTFLEKNRDTFFIFIVFAAIFVVFLMLCWFGWQFAKSRSN